MHKKYLKSRDRFGTVRGGPALVQKEVKGVSPEKSR